MDHQINTTSPLMTFFSFLTTGACTGIADTDNTAPGTAIHINALFN